MKFTLKHCPPNPSIKFANLKLKEVRHQNATELVSQGGGSTIDVGKWIAKELVIKHTAIPTTAGSGSEVTRYCVLMVDGKKTTFTDDRYIPNNYVLDPRLVVSLPREQTISSGLDAFSQALESLWSKNSTPESRSYSEIAISLIPKALIDSVNNPSNEIARMNMLIGSNFAGRAINITKTNVCHAISYPLTELYGIPHGIACALTLPYFARQVNIDIVDFIKKFNLPLYEIDKEKVAKIVLQSDKLKDYPLEINEANLLSCFM